MMKAMKIVSHSDYQTTTGIYTHMDQETLRATADGYGRGVQDSDHGGQEEPDAEAGKQGDSIPQDRQLSLISRSYGSGFFVV